MATADSDDKLNVAAFSKPTMIDEKTVAFIMAGHLTHKNLQSNHHVTYFLKNKKEH